MGLDGVRGHESPDTRGPHFNNRDVCLSSEAPVNIHHAARASTSTPVRCTSLERTAPLYIETVQTVSSGGSGACKPR
jgi:hypothetical protein